MEKFKTLIHDNSIATANFLELLVKELEKGYKVIYSFNTPRDLEVCVVLELINKPVETTNEQPKIYPFGKHLGRDVKFIMEYKDKYCLISFGENQVNENGGIVVFAPDGEIIFTTFSKLEIPNKCFVSTKQELNNLGDNWLKNYDGSY